MKPDSGDETDLIQTLTGIGMVTLGGVEQRAAELAVINGHSGQDISKSDWDQAKRELAGDSDLDPKQARLEAAPESERWDLVPSTVGVQAPESTNDEEDAEGRSNSTRQVLAGVQQAEHEQMLQAAQTPPKEI
jgi:hypothetical protein